MNFVSVEAPTVRIAATGQAHELLNPSFGIIAASELFQEVSDQLH
jgi:hypothetical protein